MATSVRTPSSTRDKLLRAKNAAARLAQFTTAEKNAILLGWQTRLRTMQQASPKRTRQISIHRG